jgi:hypothetical protein
MKEIMARGEAIQSLNVNRPQKVIEAIQNGDLTKKILKSKPVKIIN